MMLSPSALKTTDYSRKLNSLYHRSDYCDWKLTCLYWSCGSHEKLPNCDPLSSCHSHSFLTLAILTLPIQLIFTDFWLLKNLSTGRTSSHVFKNTFLDIKRPYKLGKTQRLMAELLARASGALRKFGKLSIREILVVTSAYARPYIPWRGGKVIRCQSVRWMGMLYFLGGKSRKMMAWPFSSRTKTC